MDSSTLIQAFSQNEFNAKAKTTLEFINLLYDYAQDTPLKSLEDILVEDIVIALINEIEPDYDTMATPIEINTDNAEDFGIHYSNYNNIVSSLSDYFSKHRKCNELYIKKSFIFKEAINVNLLIQKDKTTLLKFIEGIFLLTACASISEFTMPKINELEEDYASFFMEILGTYLEEEEEEADEDEEALKEEERDKYVEPTPQPQSKSSSKPKYVKKFTTKTSSLYGNFDKPRLFAEIDKLRSRNEDLEKFKTSLIASVTSLEEEKKNFDEKYDLLRYETNDWIDKYNEVVNELNQNTKQSEHIIIETNKELNKITDLENQLNLKKAEIAEKEDWYTTELEKNRRKIFDLQNDIELLLKSETDKEVIKRQFEQFKIDSKEKARALKEQVSSYESDIRILEEKIAMLQSELDKGKHTEAHQTEVIKDLEKQLEDFAVKVNSFERDTKRSLIFSFNDDNIAEDKELAKEKEVEFKRAREKNRTITMKLNQKEDENLQLKQEKMLLLRKQTMLNDEFDQRLSLEHEYYRSKHSKKLDEIDMLNKTIEEKQSQYEMAMQEIETKTQQMETLKRLLNSKTMMLDEKEQMYISVQMQSTQHEDQFNQINETMTKVKEEYKETIEKMANEANEFKAKAKESEEEHMETINALNREVNVIKEEYKDKVNELELESKRLKEETIKELEVQLKQNKEEYQEKVNELQMEAKRLKEETIKELEVQLEQSREEYNAKVLTLKTESKQWEEKHSTALKQIKEDKEEHSTMIFKLENESKELKEKHSKALKQSKEEYNAKILKMETETKELKEKHNSALKQLEVQLDKKKEEHKEISKKVDECNMKIHTLETEVAVNKKETKEKTSQLEAQLMTIEAEKDKMKKDYETESIEFKRKVNQLTKERAELVTAVEVLEKKSNRNDGKIKLQLEEKDLAIKKLQNNKRQYQVEINNLQKANEMYSKEVKERENEVKHYKLLIDQIKTQQKSEYDTLTSALYELALQFKIVRNDLAKKSNSGIPVSNPSANANANLSSN